MKIYGRFVICLSVGCAALSGCKVDQKKEVARYRQVLQEGEPATRPFNSGEELTLQRALILANENNEQLSIQGENYLQTLIAKDRAFSAFLPTISLMPQYFVQEKSNTGTVASSSVQSHRLDVPVNGQMNLFNGFRDIANNRRAAYTADQWRELLLDMQATILLDTAQTYYQIIRSEQSVLVLENSLKVQDERVRDIEARQRSGLARPLDVAQTEAAASATRVSLINARNDVRNGRAMLALLAASGVEDSRLSDAFGVPPVTPARETAEETGLSQRSDLLAAQSAVEAANQAVKAAIGEYYPSVAVNANYFLSRETFPSDSKWNALLTANVPIFSAGTIEADVRTAWSQLRQAKLSESLTKRTVIQETEFAYDNLNASRTRLTELKSELAAAQEAYRQADQSYNVGLATNLERLTAQDQLLSTQLQLTSEEFDFKVFYLDLLRSMGTLGPDLAMGAAPSTQPVTAALAPVSSQVR